LCVYKKVVDKHSNNHSPIGCFQQHLRRQYADVVGAPDEILDVDAALRMLRQPGTAHQGFFALLEDVGAGFLGHQCGTAVTVVVDPVVQ
jgi:hypothetical protein